MIKHTLDEGRAILHLRPQAPLRKEDFEQLAGVTDPYIEARGGLAGMIVEIDAFPGWDSFGAMAAHFRFVRDHHRNIRKIALVTDAGAANVAEKLVSHFVAAEIKQFPAGQVKQAEEWIVGG